MSEGDSSSGALGLEELRTAAESILERLRSLQTAASEEKRSISVLRSDAEKAVADSKLLLSQLQPVAAQITAVQTQAISEQAVIATKSEHIQNAQAHADKVRANLDRALTEAKQQQTEVEASRASAQSALEQVAKALAEVSAARASSDTDAAAIRSALDQANDSAAKVKSLASKAEGIEKKVEGYEGRLEGFATKCEEQLAAIESLLPGATSAGLAHAFDERRKTFEKPAKTWQWLFVGSVVGLALIAITGLWHVYQVGEKLTYDALLQLWLARLPIAGALIWLALYASRESALAKRLEEDYGYKAAIAASFQGFFKQMSATTAKSEGLEPAIKLCADTLATLATPPGRIYDKHALTISPGSELANTAKTMLNATAK